MGLSLTAYAVIAFVLAIFGQMLLCGLLCGFVLLAEKDEKTARQCLTAFFLTFANSVLGIALAVLGGLSMAVSAIGFFGYGRVGVAGFFGFIFGLAYIAVVVFEIIGLVNVAKGREANVPIVSGLAYRAFGFVRPKPQPQPPYNPGYPGVYPQQQAYPSQPPAGQYPAAAPGAGMPAPYAPPQPAGQPYAPAQPAAGQGYAPPQPAAEAAPAQPPAGQGYVPPPAADAMTDSAGSVPPGGIPR